MIYTQCSFLYSIKSSETAQDQTIQGFENSSGFCYTIGISNGYAMIGAGFANFSTGSAYIYERASSGMWYVLKRLEGNQGRSVFGHGVVISNGYVIIGSPLINNHTGAAYIYKRALMEHGI